MGNGAATGLCVISVTTPGGTADSSLDTPANFTVTIVSNPPSITSFTPTSGGAGTLVTVNGVNFTGTTSVTFNGTSALFNFVSDSQLTATVPAGATTGPISVTNGSGTTDTTILNPANFSITRVKDITFEPGSLTGTSGFGSTTGTVTLETGSPLKGADSMTVATGTSFGTQSYTATDEIFISLDVRLAAIPAGQVRVVRITDAGTSVGALTLETTGKLTLRSGTTSIAATPTALVLCNLSHWDPPKERDGQQRCRGGLYRDRRCCFHDSVCYQQHPDIHHPGRLRTDRCNHRNRRQHDN